MIILLIIFSLRAAVAFTSRTHSDFSVSEYVSLLAHAKFLHNDLREKNADKWCDFLFVSTCVALLNANYY
jgi:hypothetical protein